MKIIGLLLLAALLLSGVGCTTTTQRPGASSASTPAGAIEQDHSRPDFGTGSDIARFYGFALTGAFVTSQTVLPTNLSGGDWDAVNHANLRAGYDLRPYAGQAVTVASYPLAPKRGGGFSATLVVVQRDTKTVAAYVTLKGVPSGAIALDDKLLN